MSGPKGIITDLTSISSLLGTILDQTDQIFAKAGDAAGAVGKVTSGGGAGGGVGATKRGSGSQQLGLASVPAANGEMPSVAGMNEAKFGEEVAGSASMTKWSGGVFGGKAAGIVGTVASGLGLLTDVAGAGMNMMPDVNGVMNRGASFYHAGIEQGNQFSSTAMQNNAKSNGLYSTGQSGNISDYMSTMGINFGSNSWNTVSRETANAYKYLNMDPNAAAAAYTGLNTGTTSANLSRTMGIATSDSKGNSLSAENIFDQMDQRLLQPGVKYSKDDVQNNWLKGGLQASLQNMGLSPDQQELYRQHLLGRVTGKPTDMSKTATLDDLVNGATKAGNENPLAPQQKINASEESLFQSYQKPYLDGIKAAVPLIQGMNKALEGVPGWMKSFKAEMDTLAGNKGTGGAASAGGSLVNGALAVTSGALASKAVSAALKAKKSSAPAASASEKAVSKAAESTASKLAPKIGKAVAKGTGALDIFASLVDSGTGIASGMKASADDNGAWKKDPWGSLAKQAGADMQAQGPGMTALDIVTGGLLSGNTTKYGSRLAGAILPDFMNPNSKMYGSNGNPVLNAINGFSSFLNGFGTKSAKGSLPLTGARGSSGSTVGTASAGAGGGTISFILPVNGTITDGFGPRSAASTGGIGSTFHRGIDIAAPLGTPIHAGAAGKVSAVGFDGSFGNRVMIDHAGGYQSIYAHQPAGGPCVSVGQVVTQGQLIGHVGSTGASTGAHCHFEVRLNGTAINPAPLIGKSVPIKDSAPATGKATTQSTQPAPATLKLNTTGLQSQSGIISAIAQPMPQFASPGSGNASFGSQSGGSAGTAAPLVASNQQSKGYGSGAGGVSGGNQASMSVPGAGYFKAGDDYVAQDSHVNVHAGEAILNEAAADEWRRSKSGGKKSGSPVNIYLTIQDASDQEARKFAARVKQYLDEDSFDNAMGTR